MNRRVLFGAAISAPLIGITGAARAQLRNLSEVLPPGAHETFETAGLPTAPLLKVRTGFIQSQAVSRDGRTIITLEDKAAVLWSLETGAMIRTFNPPIGPGIQGKITGLSANKDHTLIAMASRTERAAAVFVFDGRTGNLLRRLDMPDVAGRMAFMQNDQVLAIVLPKGGLVVYDRTSGALIGQDLDFRTMTMAADSAPDGVHMLVGGDDGTLRLYAIGPRSVVRIAETRASSIVGHQLSDFSFSPDGRYFVSAGGTNDVSVWQTAGLVKGEGVMTGLSYFVGVTWDPTGRYIYGIGYNNAKVPIIRRWSRIENPTRPPSAFGLLSDSTTLDQKGQADLTRIAALPDGRVVVVSSSRWGFLNGMSSIDWRREAGEPRHPRIINPRSPPTLLVSKDGSHVRYTTAGGLAEASLSASAPSNDAPAPPRKNAPGLNPTVISLSTSANKPKLNGTVLAMAPDEYATAAAVNPAGDRLALATSQALRVFSKDGRELWSRAGSVMAVNISGDGRLVVADMMEGVIQWFRLSDGAERLAYYPHPDRRRWVAWTPSGYYDASPGGDGLLGWHLNRGVSHAADFFAVSDIRAGMRRPDIVKAALASDEEEQAIRLADQAAGRSEPLATPQTIVNHAPPSLEFVDAPTTFSSDRVTLHYRVSAPPGVTVGQALVAIEGAWQPRARAITEMAPDVRTITVVGLPPHDVTVQLAVDSANGRSPPRSLNLRWAGSAAPTVPKPPRKPKLFVLAVGVAKYREEALNLTYPDKDVQQLAAAMGRQQGRTYSAVTSRIIVNAEATRQATLDGLAWFTAQAAADDVGLLILAGHGYEPPTGEYYFAPTDFDLANAAATAVGFDRFQAALAAFQAKGNRVVFLIDTCFSAGILGGGRKASSGEFHANSLSGAQYQMVGLTASGWHEESLERPDWGGGAFTKALLEGIVDGKAAAQSGDIGMLSLGGYVSSRVKEITGQKQEPVFLAPTGLRDFTLASR